MFEVKAKDYLPRPQTINIVNKKGEIEKITMTFLVMDDIIALADEFTEIVNQVLNSDEGKQIDLESIKLKDLPVFKPVMNQLKKILIVSINRDEEWFGENVSLPALLIMIRKFFEVNGADIVIENFVKAKALLQKNLQKKK